MRFLTSQLEELESPREWFPAIVDLGLTIDEFDRTSVHINDIEQELIARRVHGEVHLTFNWPKLGPGQYTLKCITPEGVCEKRTKISSAKLGEDRWWSMVFDLQERLAASIAIGLQRLGGLASYEILEPGPVTFNAELNRIHKAVHGDGVRPGLLQIVPAVVRDPHTRLSSDDRLVRVHQARNIPPHLLPRSLRKLDESGTPERVVDRHQIITMNTYENQVVRLFLLTTQRRLAQIKLERGTKRERPTRVDEVIATLTGELNRLITGARSWLNEVTDLEQVPTSITMVILKRPEYRAAMEGYLHLHRNVSVHADVSSSQMVLENTPALYQQWCSLVVIEQMIGLVSNEDWQIQHQSLITRDSRGLILRMPRNGKPVLTLRNQHSNQQLSITLEPSYGSGETIRSLSFTQVPDIVLKCSPVEGKPRLLVLDPKYKLDSEDDNPEYGSPVKTDIDKMHAYRDAIVNEKNDQLVEHAAILYPGMSYKYGPHISAMQLLPGESGIRDELTGLLSKFLRG